MDRVLRAVAGRLIHTGNLRIITAAGTSLTFGDGTGKPVRIRFTSRAAQWGMLLHPELRFGEAYMDGTLAVEQGSIADVLAIVLGQGENGGGWPRLRRAVRFLCRRLLQFNPRRLARRRIAHHYDLNEKLYTLFLDADRQYSCAYFEHRDQSLDDAQLAKKRHLAAKLLLKPGGSVLDVGCGWGGLALYLAETCRVQVTGITLSRQQHAVGQIRAQEKGVSETVGFRLQDYREVTGKFDRIVSVGMFEHVGVGFYGTFFRKCRELLHDDGVMLLHAIGRSEGPNVTNPW